MSSPELGTLVWRVLVGDVVDSSAGNPSLLTLANLSPQRVSTGALIVSTTLANPAVIGDRKLVLAGKVPGGAELFINDPANPEPVIAEPGAPSATIALTSPLTAGHAAGTPVNGLPGIITTEEPRIPLVDAGAYWRCVVGPITGHPNPTVPQRAPVRRYEAIAIIKVYEQSASRALVERVLNRLDYLLNIGEAGCNGNPDRLLGSSPTISVNSCKLVLTPSPYYDGNSQVAQYPLEFHILYSKTFE